MGTALSTGLSSLQITNKCGAQLGIGGPYPIFTDKEITIDTDGDLCGSAGEVTPTAAPTPVPLPKCNAPGAKGFYMLLEDGSDISVGDPPSEIASGSWFDGDHTTTNSNGMESAGAGARLELLQSTFMFVAPNSAPRFAAASSSLRSALRSCDRSCAIPATRA